MRRIFLMLLTLISSGACLIGSVSAQESSVFRYASDPFSEEANEKESTSAKEANGEETESAESSYDSYASWPSGNKNLVQRKAMFRTQQRELRIATRQWYGYSASRPPVFGNPYYMEAYSPSLWRTPRTKSVEFVRAVWLVLPTQKLVGVSLGSLYVRGGVCQIAASSAHQPFRDPAQNLRPSRAVRDVTGVRRVNVRVA